MFDILITSSQFSQKEVPEGCRVIANPMDKRLGEDDLIKLLAEYRPDAVVAGLEPFSARVLEAAKGLKVVSRIGTGIDSVDLDCAARLGIKVCRTPDAPCDSVAELALASILCVIKSLHIMNGSMKSGEWKPAKSRLLAGKTVGIVGCGRIGTRLAALLSPFGCRLLGYDPFAQAAHGINMVALDELLALSDVVSLHLPITPESRNILSAESIAKMKPGSILVNTARGGLVDEDALADALASGHISGCALDCFAEEPYGGELRHFPNAVLTPHIGSASAETRERMEREALQNAADALNGIG